MRPIDTETSEFWPDELCQAKLRSIRGDVHEELEQRDRARGVPADGKVYHADPATQTMVIDPELARHKHTGDEETALIKLRWAEFCLESRPLKEFAVHERTSTRRRALEEARAVAARYNGNGKGAAGQQTPIDLPPGDEADKASTGFICGQCGEVCRSAGGLRLHMKAHEKAARIPRNG